MFRRVVTLAPSCVWMCATLFGQPVPGRPLPGLTPQENGTFQEGQKRFRNVVSVLGTEAGTQRNGLGPRFNLNSCAGCHAQPAPGGSSPAANPQISLATADGAANTIPPFIQSSGPVRVARFILTPDGHPDGGVHDLFVISGRADAGSCAIPQPDFAAALAQNNVSFRIPTPLFGAGLIEAIDDATLLSNLAANPDLKTAMGIAGRPNLASDGSIARFGWKAQVRSLEEFAAEAYNVEMGVTNELYRTELNAPPGCTLNPLPEDQTNFASNSPTLAMSDVAAFAEFMRWLAPLQPAPPGPPSNGASVARGQQTFAQVGCNLCHTPTMTTGNTTSAALHNKTIALYSDLLLHHMGSGLADGISQGLATGDEFRTAPLWGLGQRLYFLHDGRATDLQTAIQAHAGAGSEAAASIAAFNALSQQAIQDVLNFLHSL